MFTCKWVWIAVLSMFVVQASAATWRVKVIAPDSEVKIYEPASGTLLELGILDRRCVLATEGQHLEDEVTLYKRAFTCTQRKKEKLDFSVVATCRSHKGIKIHDLSSVMLFNAAASTFYTVAIECHP